LELATELEASLRDLGSAGSVELRENGGRVAVFTALWWEVRGAAQKPLLHLWSEQHNLTRRVLAITDHSDQCLALAVERFAARVLVAWSFSVWSSTRPPAICPVNNRARVSAASYATSFPTKRWNRSPALKIWSTRSPGIMLAVLRKGSTRWAVLGVFDHTSSEGAENCLTFGLL
jgi:hypothetical protein